MEKINDRLVQLEIDVLSANDKKAAQNREKFIAEGILALNLVSSPGSGKTTLLCNTINKIKDQYKLAVIEGDQQTLNDAERIRATGCRAIQINTGEGCHLDADMIEEACQKIKPEPNSAAFDLGEDCKVVLLSVTEGEDKPIKYPDMFAASSLMLINKVDLLPYVDFSVEKCKEYARRVNPNIEFIEVSATKGTGMDAWCEWLGKRFAAVSK